MPAQPAPNSEYSYYDEDQVVTAQTITASGATAALGGFGLTRGFRVHVVLATVTGTTPSYTFSVEDTLDGTNWIQLAAGSALTAAGTQGINVSAPFSDRIRVRWVVSGTTPSAVANVYIASQTLAT